MIPTTRPLLFAALAALIFLLPCSAQYKYVTLQPTSDLPNDGTVSTWTHALNNSNQVAGYEVDPTGNHFVVVWTNAAPEKRELPSGYVFEFSGIEINDSGQVLTNLQLGGPAGANAAVLWTGSTPAILPPGPNPCAGPGLAANYAIDLNNLGHVLGKTAASGCTTYWIWDGKTFHIIQPPTPPACTPTPFSAVAINNKDEVLGMQSPPACSAGPLPVVVRADGSFAFYVAPPAGVTVSYVTSINDLDEVSGGGSGPAHAAVALFWQSASATPSVIHSPNPSQGGTAPGRLNNIGEFILTAQNNAGQFPYVWNSGKAMFLAPRGIVIPSSGGGIDDVGKIAVSGLIGGSFNWSRGLWIVPIP